MYRAPASHAKLRLGLRLGLRLRLRLRLVEWAQLQSHQTIKPVKAVYGHTHCISLGLGLGLGLDLGLGWERGEWLIYNHTRQQSL